MSHLPQRTKLTIAWKHLIFLIIPMLVVTFSEALLATFADTDMSFGELVLIDTPVLTELTGRYRFLSVYFFYVAAAVTVLGIFGAELLSRHRRASIIRVGLGFLGLVLFSFLFSIWEPAWMGSFESYELLGAELFEEGLGTGTMPLCTAGKCNGNGAFHAMRLLMGTINVLSALAVSSVILGMIVSLARPRDVDLTTRQGILDEGHTLQEAQKAVRRYLYLSGVLLSAGMMLGLAWMMWPAGLLADSAQARSYSDLVQSISLYRGVSYTVLILSFYMPVSLVQMVRIERFHDAASANDMEEIAKDVQGFDIERIGSLDAFKAILSILSPIIASAVGSFASINVLG